jgi:hypothetical protein
MRVWGGVAAWHRRRERPATAVSEAMLLKAHQEIILRIHLATCCGHKTQMNVRTSSSALAGVMHAALRLLPGRSLLQCILLGSSGFGL